MSQKKENRNVIKELIDYILNEKDSIDEEILNSINPGILSFLYLIFAKNPHALYLYNKWFNHLYDNYTSSVEETKKFVDNLKFLAYKLGITSRNRLHIPKSMDRQTKTNFYEFLDKIFDRPLNDQEKAFYYYLYYKYDLIDKSFIDEYVNNTKIKKEKVNDEELIRLLEEYEKANRPKFNTVKELEDYILEIKRNKKYCSKCPLKDLPPIVENQKDVILDSNTDNIDEIMFLIVGINPGETEAKEGKPFVGKSGEKLREVLNYLEFKYPQFKYAITNVILCATKNQDDLGNVKTVLKYCKYYQDVIDNLPNLKYIIAVGDIPKNAFGIKGRITKIAGEEFKLNNQHTIICIPHPSALLRNSKASLEAWNRAWNKIESIISNLNNTTTHTITQSNIQTTNIDIIHKNDNLFVEITNINDIPQDQTLFDIKVLKEENKYLFIMIDKEGNKHYYKLPFYFEFYIKPNTLPQLCHYLEDLDKLQKVAITDYEELQKIRYSKLDDLKKLINN